MKIILMLAVSLSLIGCAKNAPKYPTSLTTFHLVEVIGQPLDKKFLDMVVNKDDMENRLQVMNLTQEMNCLKFQVVQFNPYKFQFISQVPNLECHQVMGYKPDEEVTLWNWIDDIMSFLDAHNCFNKKG